MWTYFSKYNLDGLEADQIEKNVIELLKPCSPTITAHFARLQAFKPFYEADQAKVDIIYSALVDDLIDFPEVAVVLALDDIRTSPGRFFPTAEDILSEVKINTDLIYDVLDFFKN